MNKLLLKLNFWIEKQIESKPRSERSIFTKFWQNLIKKTDNLLLYYLLKIKMFLNLIRVEPLIDLPDLPIVSLTSFPSRLDNLWMVIYQMYFQTVRPSKICLTLANDEFERGYETIPLSLKFFADKGLEFIFVPDNLKPHNKYYYCRLKYPNRIVVTIDDDMLYYPNTLENLMVLHNEYPFEVCANRVQLMLGNSNTFENHNQWEVRTVNRSPSHSLLALGYAAVLYPPSFMPPVLYDKFLIKQLSLSADDLWLKAIEIVNDVKVVSGEYYPCPITLPFSQSVSLSSKNNSIENPQNDICMEQLNNHFGLTNYL